MLPPERLRRRSVPEARRLRISTSHRTRIRFHGTSTAFNISPTWKELSPGIPCVARSCSRRMRAAFRPIARTRQSRGPQRKGSHRRLSNKLSSCGYRVPRGLPRNDAAGSIHWPLTRTTHVPVSLPSVCVCWRSTRNPMSFPEMIGALGSGCCDGNCGPCVACP